MRKKLVLFLLTALILNIIWEFSHYRLYNDLSAVTGTPHLFIASFTDALIILLIYLAISITNKNSKLLDKPGKKEYFAFILIALMLAIIIEIVNLKLGRWSYKSSMPTILGIGLSPLVQLAITGTLSIWITKHNL